MKTKDIKKIENAQFGDFEIKGYSVKYNQLIPNGKITLTRTISSVPTQNTLDPYITIIDPIPNQVVYAKITTSDSRFRVGWYQGFTSGYDFATGQEITASSTLPLANEGVYMITSDMVHSGTNYLQLYFATFIGLPIGTYDITIQLFNITDLGVNSLSEFKKTKEYAYINAGREVEYNQLTRDFSYRPTGMIGWYSFTTFASRFNIEFSDNNRTAKMTMKSNYIGTDVVLYHGGTNMTIGHKYLVCCSIKSSTNKTIKLYLGGQTNQTISLQANVYTRATFIETKTLTNDVCGFIGLSDENWNNGDNIEFSNFELIDLTANNLDSVSTIADFYQTDLGRAVLGNFYLPYSATNTKVFVPYLPIAKGTGIVSATSPFVCGGENLWDEEWEVGGLNLSNGDLTSNQNYFRSKNFISVKPNATYYQTNKGVIGHCALYDINKNFIKPIYNIENLNIHTTSDCYYIKFYITTSNTYKHDIAIFEGSTPKPYVPYIHNELTRFGRVGLWTLTWYLSNGVFYTIGLPYDKVVDSVAIMNGYTQYFGSSSSMGDRQFTLQGGASKTLWAKDSRFDNPTDFKNSLYGIYLDYEMTTPLQLNAIGEFQNLFVLNGDNRNDNSTRSVDLKNNSMTITSTKDFTSSQASAVRIRMAYSSGRAKIGNSYFACALIKTTNKDSSSTYKAIFSDQGIVGTFVDENNSSDLTNQYKRMFTKIKSNYNLDLTISLSSYSNIKIGDNIVSKDLVVVDMTALGLDTLTAQQFYDQFKDQFDNLANGKSGYKLVDTYRNTSGKCSKMLGIVDMGTLNWAVGTGDYAHRFASTTLENIAKVPTNVREKQNLICSKYQTDTPYNIWRVVNDKSISTYPSGNNAWLLIRDDNYSTADELKQALSGVYLIYELNQPTTETLPSVRLQKQTTTITDKNGVELEFVLKN